MCEGIAIESACDGVVRELMPQTIGRFAPRADLSSLVIMASISRSVVSRAAASSMRAPAIATVGVRALHVASRRMLAPRTSVPRVSAATFSTVAAATPAAPAAASSALVLVDIRAGGVGVLTLNRPKALNALCNDLVHALNTELRRLDADPTIGCIIITGSEKAFAAGADIKEMAGQTFVTAYNTQMLAFWTELGTIRKPIIAAVNGYALGGGCELAMMCDFIIAGDRAKFGQPEITLGTIPGCGGTQRLTRIVGKSKAMDLCLTGDMLTAEAAERAGLVSRVVPAAELLNEAVKTATKIASMSKPIAALVKEAVNAAYETTLTQGVLFERRLFYATFATVSQTDARTHAMQEASDEACDECPRACVPSALALTHARLHADVFFRFHPLCSLLPKADQKEGMAAFVGKRPAVFKDQ
jgi:enoyl-CoA hydratase